MAYAIRVRDAFPTKVGKHRHGWISAWGYTTASNLDSARKFLKIEAAETFALLLIPKVPEYIGRLEAVCVVVGPRRTDGWRIHLRQVKKENRHGTVLR